MAEEIDESGFYRADFSTESDWEVFVHHLGEVSLKWELATEWGRQFKKNELFHCEWEVQTHTLELLKKKIDVNYYYALLNDDPEIEKCSDLNETEPSPVHKDLISVSNTFGTTTSSNNDLHPLARLYGIRRFVVIHPRHLQTEFLTHPAEFSFFLSAAAVVAAEVDSAVPIFVQIYDPKWNFFVGVSVAPTLRTNFDVIALEQAPPNCRYLSGLLSIFKDKLNTSYLNAARVSVQNTYSMDTIRLRISMSIPFSTSHMPDVDQESSAIVLKTSHFNALPHGYFPDSCTEVYAVYTWPEIHENIAIDSEMRSDFVPSKAPFGEIHQKVHATSYLSSCLHDYMHLIGSIESLESFVGRNFSGTINIVDDNPLHHLTQSTHLRHFRPHRQNVVKTQSPYKKLPGPMNENELNQMLCYLFPDLHPDIAMFPYSKKSVRKVEFDPQRIKSAGPDSLILRLSCLLATCNAHFGGKNGLAQLWAAFTREIRIFWDTCQLIPGVGVGFPDTRTCLLHQKLQMLNVCTQRCKSREFGDKQDAGPKPAVKKSTSDDDEDDCNEDEFYDCPNYDEPEENKPEGRLKHLDELKLLDSEEPLYVPVTQEPVPKTEDQLHDDAEVMLKLGPGSGLTTQMMCSSLLSDMEAFKAANPKAKIEDFIRWYSPKDWEETMDDGKTVGKLSARMLHPDNTWQRVWKEAKPIPAWRQKRLFDDTNEGLKVLHYLETRNIGEIYELTIVPILHTAVLKMMDILKSSNVLDLFSEQISTLLTDLCRLSRDIEIVGQTELGPISQSPNPEPVLHQIEALERHFYQYKCLESMSGYPQCSKLDDVKRQFTELMKNGGCFNIIGKQNYKLGDGDGSEGGNMLNPSFKNEMHDNLISKDYVIRMHGETTSTTKGKMGSQFLRAIVTGNKIRLAGAFTENTTFV